MANLDFCDKHNMVAFLKKPEGSEGFHQIVDFLNSTHIKYSLTENPTIYVSLIYQFWQNTSTSTSENGEMEITTTIDGRVKTLTEASIMRHLKLEDSDGIITFPNTKIFEQLTLMGPKKTAWEQFSSNIATAIICLATNRTFNFSKMIFEGMVKNLDTPIMQGEGLTILVESHHTPLGAPTTSQPALSSPSRIPTRQETEVPQPSSPTYTNVADEAAFTSVDVVHEGVATTISSIDAGHGSSNIPKSPTMPHDSPLPGVDSLETELKKTKQTYGAALTKLIKKVKKLEQTVKTSQARRRANIEPDFEFIAPEEDYTVEPDISTANVPVSTAGAEVSTVSPEVITAAESLVYIRRSAAKRKDKGTSIMKEAKPVHKKTKLQLEQERLRLEEALRLQEQLDEEERQRIARVHEEASISMPKNRITYKLKLKLMKS
ncbi:hypothetical protein Tco_0724219 [Tanacetum coccineum]